MRTKTQTYIYNGVNIAVINTGSNLKNILNADYVRFYHLFNRNRSQLQQSKILILEN